MILTNPPFGGEEEAGIQGNFPEDKQTSETALLFLQLIMRQAQASGAKARRMAGRARRGGRAQRHALRRRRVRPHQGGAAKEFNLHTIVRLPNGVFAPYTGIPTNLLFFDRSGPTKDVWYLRASAARRAKELHQDAAAQFEEFQPSASRGGRSARRTTGHGR